MIRQVICRTATAGAAALAMIIGTDAAGGRSLSPAADDALGSCQRAVSRIGAQIGHVKETTPEGKAVYVFTIRGNSQRYTVRCDAATGSLGAVERVASSGGTAIGE